jgi:uncharacterized protein
MAELPVLPPTPTPESQPYWDATAEGKILLPRCDDCSTVIWYPRTTCPACMSTDVSWFEASGKGSIYSFAVVRRQGGPWRDALPYVLAYVELDEGPRVLTNIVEAVAELEVGQRVEAVFCDTGQGTSLVRFRPT